jgi:hypothetical protein
MGGKMNELELVKPEEKQLSISQKQSLFFDVARFEHAQRIAKMFSSSTMVPDHFKSNMGNCLIALNYAERVGADVFMVMQSLYVVHGRPGIEAKLAIALLNSSGRFTPLKYKYNKDKTECYAYATDIATNEKCDGPTCSIDLAKKEGWYSKKGSKWQTMPELMLMYRSASFFIKMYAPEVLLGMQTKEELTDIYDMELKQNGSYAPVEITPEKTVAEKLRDDTQNGATEKGWGDAEVVDKETTMSNAASDEIDTMISVNRPAYVKAVERFGADPKTNDDVEKIGVIWADIVDSQVKE